jgi:hypothetical protein
MAEQPDDNTDASFEQEDIVDIESTELPCLVNEVR